MANEADVRQRIGKLLREYGFFVQAMETGAIADGVPDMWYSKKIGAEGVTLRSGWLELKKVRTIPAKMSTSLFRSLNHGLSNYQVNWIESCVGAGTRASILVAYERRYFFVPGRYANDFNDFTWDDLQKFEVMKDDIPGFL